MSKSPESFKEIQIVNFDHLLWTADLRIGSSSDLLF